MTADGGPGLSELRTALTALTGQLAKVPGKDGAAIRTHVERLAAVLGADGPDAELRQRFFGNVRLALYGGAGLPQALYDRFLAPAEEASFGAWRSIAT